MVTEALVRPGNISTADTARDMDHLRQLVGDARLTYLGWSYGTFVGGRVDVVSWDPRATNAPAL